MPAIAEPMPLSDVEFIGSPSKAREARTTRAQISHIAFADIDSPGAYVVLDFGLLLRVPQEALIAGRNPVFDLAGRMPLQVTRISGNPWLPIGTARKLAADNDLEVEF